MIGCSACEEWYHLHCLQLRACDEHGGASACVVNAHGAHIDVRESFLCESCGGDWATKRPEMDAPALKAAPAAVPSDTAAADAVASAPVRAESPAASAADTAPAESQSPAASPPPSPQRKIGRTARRRGVTVADESAAKATAQAVAPQRKRAVDGSKFSLTAKRYKQTTLPFGPPSDSARDDDAAASSPELVKEEKKASKTKRKRANS